MDSTWRDPITKKKYNIDENDYYILNGYKYHTSTIRKMILVSGIGQYLNSSLEKFMNKSLEEHIYKESDDEDDVLVNVENQIRGRTKKRDRLECKVSTILKCPVTNKGLSSHELYTIWIHFSQSNTNVFK